MSTRSTILFDEKVHIFNELEEHRFDVVHIEVAESLFVDSDTNFEGVPVKVYDISGAVGEGIARAIWMERRYGPNVVNQAEEIFWDANRDAY